MSFITDQTSTANEETQPVVPVDASPTANEETQPVVPCDVNDTTGDAMQMAAGDTSPSCMELKELPKLPPGLHILPILQVGEVISGYVLEKKAHFAILQAEGRASTFELDSREATSFDDLQVNDKLEVVVTAMEPKHKVSQVKAWALRIEEKRQKAAAYVSSLKPGDRRSGKVLEKKDFGAIIELLTEEQQGTGITGLVHVNALSGPGWAGRKARLEQLQVGDQLEVSILQITPREGKPGQFRISLSERQVKYAVGMFFPNCVVNHFTSDGNFAVVSLPDRSFAHLEWTEVPEARRNDLKKGSTIDVEVISLEGTHDSHISVSASRAVRSQYLSRLEPGRQVEGKVVGRKSESGDSYEVSLRPHDVEAVLPYEAANGVLMPGMVIPAKVTEIKDGVIVLTREGFKPLSPPTTVGKQPLSREQRDGLRQARQAERAAKQIKGPSPAAQKFGPGKHKKNGK